jgi:streptogramin lyase
MVGSVIIALLLSLLFLLSHGQLVDRTVLQVYNTSNPSILTTYGVAVDASGNVYMSDYFGNRVVKVDANNNLLWAYNYTYASAVALDSRGNTYVGGRAHVVKLDATSNSVQFVFNTSNPPLGSLIRMTLDSSDNLYINDNANRRVVKLDPNNNLLSVYNTSNPPLSGPGGVTVDASGNLYIADLSNHRVVKIDQSNNILMIWSLNASFGAFGPSDVTLDSSGNLFITDALTSRVLKMDVNNNVLVVYNTTSPKLYLPYGVKLGTNGNIYIADSYNNRVVVMSSHNPNPSSNGSASVLFSSVCKDWLSAAVLLLVLLASMAD